MKTTGIMKSDKGRISFVEDEKLLLDMYHDFFERNGYDFLSTGDIKEAMTVTQFEKPDVIMLDIIIPKPENTVAEQGYEFLETVKKNPLTKDVPVIVFTNLNTEKDREKSRQMGAAAYIFKKDTIPRRVLETVAEIIEQHRKKGKIRH